MLPTRQVPRAPSLHCTQAGVERCRPAARVAARSHTCSAACEAAKPRRPSIPSFTAPSSWVVLKRRYGPGPCPCPDCATPPSGRPLQPPHGGRCPCHRPCHPLPSLLLAQLQPGDVGGDSQLPLPLLLSVAVRESEGRGRPGWKSQAARAEGGGGDRHLEACWRRPRAAGCCR